MTTRYTREHEWVRLEGDVAVVGISKYAQDQLGDIVYVELPEIGKKLAKGAEAAVVESVKDGVATLRDKRTGVRWQIPATAVKAHYGLRQTKR